MCIRDRCTEEETDKHVELRMCLATRLPLPVTVQRCHVDCHAPCQLTEWSAWTLCNQPCSGARSRTRQLIGIHMFCIFNNESFALLLNTIKIKKQVSHIHVSHKFFTYFYFTCNYYY